MKRASASRLIHSTLGTCGVALVLLLGACSSGTTTTDGGGQPSASHNPGQQARVAQITPAEGDSTIEIGVGEEQVNDQLRKYLPTSMAATCTPGVNGAPYTVAIDSPNGWHIVLTHGTQQFTAENSQLGLSPAATFTTDQDEIDLANQSNIRIAENHNEQASRFNGAGLTWDKPTPYEVEAKISGRDFPEYWPSGENQGPPEFTLSAHVKC